MKKQKNKKIVTTTIILLLGIFLFGLNSKNIFSKERVQPDRQVTMNIKNMTCSMCGITIKKSISNLNGVTRVQVTKIPPRAVAQYNSKMISKDRITKASTESGYPASVLEDKEIKE